MGLLVAVTLDEAWQALCAAWDEGRQPDAIAVSTDVYQALETTKAAEIRRGWPLSLLGLTVVASSRLDGTETLVW
jgi:hypothetical protein